MNIEFYEALKEEGFISEESFEKIKERHQTRLFSLHWELKTLLYLGVMLLSTGLGLLIYKHIDTIGHQAILALIAAISSGCFLYCIKKRPPFSREQVKAPNPLFDYLLLLGCLSFLTFVGYLQSQYTVFGTNYGMATFIPMLVLFLVAYEFDHLGVLSMGIANLAVWMGVSVTPAAVFSSGAFDSLTVVYTYLLLGLLLLLAGYLTAYFNFKKHFKFSYLHFGIHLSMVSLLCGYYYLSNAIYSFFWMLGLFVLAYYLYHDAVKNKSFYFLLLVVIYTYVAVTMLVFKALFYGLDIAGFIPMGLYFIASSIALIRLLTYLNKKIKVS